MSRESAFLFNNLLLKSACNELSGRVKMIGLQLVKDAIEIFFVQGRVSCFDQAAGGAFGLYVAAHGGKRHDNAVMLETAADNVGHRLHAFSLAQACSSEFLHNVLHGVLPFLRGAC